MKTTLWEIERQYREVVAELEENGGEITPEIDEILAINRDDFEDKVEAYFVIISEYNSYIERRKLEIERLKTLIKKDEEKVEYLEERLKNALFLYGGSKITTKGKQNYFSDFKNLDIKLTSSASESVRTVEGFNNKDYCEYKIVDKLTFQELEKVKSIVSINEEAIPDKRKIKDALDNGKDIDGAELEIKYNIKFK
jgi:hypothetical protein